MAMKWVVQTATPPTRPATRSIRSRSLRLRLWDWLNRRMQVTVPSTHTKTAAISSRQSCSVARQVSVLSTGPPDFPFFLRPRCEKGLKPSREAVRLSVGAALTAPLENP